MRDRVQGLLGNRQQVTHALTFAGDLIECGFCGHQITGESKTKQTKSGPREYVYYRCTKYNKPDHPRIRIKEADIDDQVLAFFDRIRIEDDTIRDWFRAVLASKTKDAQARHALEALNRSRDENAELASRVFELSQILSDKWLTAEYEEQRQILEIV